jgi:hypothetical protein
LEIKGARKHRLALRCSLCNVTILITKIKKEN